MDATTWVDAKVKSWIAENAIAIQLDVDKDKESATSLKIQAMPTIVVFSADVQSKEFDRQVGYKSADEMLTWLNAVKIGKTSAELINDEVRAAISKGGEEEVQARFKQAQHFLDTAKYDEATTEYIWLWNNIPKQQPSMVGVRGSFMASFMHRLALLNANAKERFEELRKEAAKSDDRSDWIVLNDVLGQEADTLAWFDQVKSQPDAAEKFKHAGPRLEALLLRNKRWTDITDYLYKDPIAELRHQYETFQEFKKIAPGTNVPAFDPFSKAAGILYASLLTTGHDEKANELAETSFKLEDSLALRGQLLRIAYRAGQSRPIQLKWVESAPATSKDAQFYKARGEVYREVKQFKLALSDYDHVIELGKPSAGDYWIRAGILIELKQYGKAVDDLTRAIELNGPNAELYAARGDAYLGAGKYKEALADVDRAISLNPTGAWAYTTKSDIYLHEKKFQEAYDAACKSIELLPDNSAGFCNKGEAELNLGRNEEALADLTKAATSEDQACAGEAHYFRALVYDKLGKTDLAKQDREISKQLGFVPDHVD